MKRSLLIWNVLFIANFIIAQKVYTVKSGDTLYNVSKTQNVSIDELYEMNPELKETGLQLDSEIIISPAENASTGGKLVYKTVPTSTKTISTDQYVVQKGNTLYAIGKKFGLKSNELIELNPGLTSDNLKIGQVLNITKKSKVVVSEDKVVSPEDPKEYYTVVKGDTFYSLSKRFNTDEATLKTYNPVLVNGLKIGQKIYFPKVDDGFTTHKVKKGETIFSITRKYNVSLATLLEHNPSLKNGLKTGMKLQIPVKAIEEEENKGDVDKETLKDYLNVVYILPFNSENYTSSKKRSFSTAEFYMGSLFALDSLTTRGKKIQVKTFDNKATLNETQEIAKKIDFKEVDLIIGPLRSDNVHWLADHVKGQKVKIISPFSRSVNVSNRENLIKANLTQETIAAELSNKIKVENQFDSIFIIGNDNKELKGGLSAEFKNSYIEQIPSIKEYDFTVMPSNSSVILNTTNTSIAKAALRKMHSSKIQDHNIEVFAIGYNASYIKGKGQNNYFLGTSLLTDLGLTALIPNYFDDNKYNVYKTKYDYMKENKAFPDKYSSSGFDWTYYMLLNDEYKNPKKVQEGLFNKIQLEKIKDGGYINKGIFTIRY